ncbi:outer membrane lipoprotein carrier protein LolA [Solimonas flava]|uniref:outer membrane lipoprotein carrier protein LolA n=1 Tax=Solimonas flava TaxID=415849 RepID=UPI0004280D35|nr:outer membrane lipoprotein carrier protein LolA [Solimonas flava]
MSRRVALAALLALGAATAVAAPAAPSREREAVFAHPADTAAIHAALGAVTHELAAAQSIAGLYTQNKFLHELPQPLRAGGDFLFVRDLGVAWRTTTPFASELIVTRDALVQRDGGSTVRVAAEQQPAVRMVARIFFAVFSLDFSQLTELFTLSVLPAADGSWQLGLTPKQDAGAIEAIVVGGHRSVERVRLYERGGDRTEIEFRDAQVSTRPAGDALRARFR